MFAVTKKKDASVNLIIGTVKEREVRGYKHHCAQQQSCVQPQERHGDKLHCTIAGDVVLHGSYHSNHALLGIQPGDRKNIMLMEEPTIGNSNLIQVALNKGLLNTSLLEMTK
jgi:hypothetical protein